ncbi:MAG: precorrin-6y C5,15-methyltransferase (decarboxylating) subunit CbiE [Dehalococcoidia bacterium]|nr:precorrin-6y C5,15-methyltransferase (decarboxylating) subunit CbiE [Dehalococcoidia bacterium]
MGDKAMPEGSVTIVGVGPGDPNMVTLAVRELVQHADVVAGFGASLAIVDGWIAGERLALTYHNQEVTLASLARLARDRKRCVVCAYGDPSVSAREFVELVRKHWPDAPMVPGVSSVQVSIARAGIAAEDSIVITLHRRGGTEQALAELEETARSGHRHIVLLPRPHDFMPPAIAAYLLEQGAADAFREVLVYERLTLPGETALRTTLGDLAASAQKFSNLTVMVLLKSPAPPSPAPSVDGDGGADASRP